MKTVIAIIFCLALGAYAQDRLGSHSKGLTYYKYIIKPELGIPGDVFTKKYTTQEWQALFDDGAKGFKKQFSNVSPKLDAFLASDKFKQIAPDLRAFTIFYAQDSGYLAPCDTKERF